MCSSGDFARKLACTSRVRRVPTCMQVQVNRSLYVTNTLTLCSLVRRMCVLANTHYHVVERTGIDAWIQHIGSVHGIVLALCLR